MQSKTHVKEIDRKESNNEDTQFNFELNVSKKIQSTIHWIEIEKDGPTLVKRTMCFFSSKKEKERNKNNKKPPTTTAKNGMPSRWLHCLCEDATHNVTQKTANKAHRMDEVFFHANIYAMAKMLQSFHFHTYYSLVSTKRNHEWR